MSQRISRATAKYLLIFSIFSHPALADPASVTSTESCTTDSLTSSICAITRVFSASNENLLFSSGGNLVLSGTLGSIVNNSPQQPYLNLTPSAQGVVVNAGITGVTIKFESNAGEGINSSITNKTGASIYSALGASIKTLELSSGAINSTDTAIFLTSSDSTGTDIIVRDGAFIQGARNAIRFDTDFTINQTLTNSFASDADAAAGITGNQTLRVKNEGIIASNPRLINQPSDLTSNAFYSTGNDRVQRNVEITNEATGKIYGGMTFGNKNFSATGSFIKSEVSLVNKGLISSNQITSDFTTKLTLVNEAGATIRIEESPIAGSNDVTETAATSTDIFKVYEGTAFASDPLAIYDAPNAVSIRTQGDNSVITNYGTIIGNINVSGTSHTINLNGGTVTGDITFAGTLNFSNDFSSSALIGDLSTRSDRATGQSSARINIGTKTYDISSNTTYGGNLSISAGTGLHPIISTTFTNDGAIGRLNFDGKTTIESGVRLNINIGENYSYLKSGVDYLIIDGDHKNTGITTSDVKAIDDSSISINDGTMGSNKIGILTLHSAARDLSGTDTYKDLVVYIERLSADEITTDENAKKVYNVIGEINSNATGKLKDFQQFIDTNSDLSAITTALKSATPQADDGIRQTSLNIFNNSARNIENRLDEIRGAYFRNFNDLRENSLGSTAEMSLAPESTYLSSRANYLSARAELAKTEPSSLESENSYLESRASYLSARSAFLETEKSKLKLDLSLAKSGLAPLETELAYYKDRDNYLKAIEEFLASEPNFEKSEKAYLDARTAYLMNAKVPTSSLQINYLQAQAALQTAKAAQTTLHTKYLDAKTQLAKAQSQYSLESEISYLKARVIYLDSKAKLEKFDAPTSELQAKAEKTETAYFNARAPYLNSLNLNQVPNTPNSKSSYSDLRDEFLKSQQAAILEESKLLKNSPIASKATTIAHLNNLNRYLDSISVFLRSEQKYLECEDYYLMTMAAYLNAQLDLIKAENTFLEAKNSQDTQTAKQKFITAKAAYLNSPANPAIDHEEQYLKSRETYLASLKTLTEAIAANNKNSSAVAETKESKDLFKNINAWAQTFGIDAKQNSFQGGEGYNLNTTGLILGLDAEVSKRSRVGLALSFASSNIKALDKLKRIGVETYQLNAYSGHLFGKYFVDTIGAIALNNYKSYREIPSVGVTATGSFNGQGYAAKVRGGYIQKLGQNFSLIPEVSLMFANNNVSNYSEGGAGTMNLDVRTNSTNFLEGRVGLNLKYKTTTKKGSILTPQLKTSYGYDFIGKRQSTVNNFAGQSATFTIISSKYDPRSFRAGGAVELYQLNSITLSSEYTFELKSKYQSHTGTLRGTYRF